MSSMNCAERTSRKGRYKCKELCRPERPNMKFETIRDAQTPKTLPQPRASYPILAQIPVNSVARDKDESFAAVSNTRKRCVQGWQQGSFRPFVCQRFYTSLQNLNDSNFRSFASLITPTTPQRPLRRSRLIAPLGMCRLE